MFGLEDMKKIVYGGLVREKETGTFSFSRMTEKQYGYFTREEDARFLVRMGCTAGICMDFYTDSGSLEFDYEISGMSDRDIVQLDICQNGVRTGGPVQKPGKDTVGSIRHRIDRDGHRWNRITVWLPYMSSIALKNISLAPGASLCTLEEGTPDGDFPGRIRKKLLCYGDSITQGYDALHPSQSYAVRLARYFDWELWNAGLSGYIFDAGLLDDKLPFRPDIVTVAFGTNDWNWAESKEEAVRNAERYFDKIMELYPGRPIFYFSPLWRKDTGVPTKAGEFRPFCLALLNAAKERGIEAIDGYLAAPHKEDALADGILHPNDEGMACYSEYAAKIFMKYGLTEDFWPGWFACRY